MRCTRVHKRSSAFLDGDMSPEEMAAIRGHLRICEDCAALVEQERELVAAAAELESPEPPDSLWSSIQERIAEEEIAESQKSALQLWWSAHWQPALGAGAAVALAALLWLAPWQKATSSESGSPALAVNGPQGVEVTLIEEAHAVEMDATETDYQGTVDELRLMVSELSADWRDEEKASFQKSVDDFENERAGLRAGRASSDLRGRDELWNSYRREIALLESVVFEQEDSLAFAGGLR